MNNKRKFSPATVTFTNRSQKVFKPFPMNTTQPMVMYRTPSQFNSLTNPPQARIWPEKKNIDVEGSTGNVTAWSELDLLNPIAQGSSANGNRIGRKVQMKSLVFRYVASTSAYPTDIRILIIYDKQSDGLAPDIAQVLQGAPPTYNAPMNLTNSDRFVVLADEIDNTFAGGQSVYSRSGKIYRKINLPQHYTNAITGTVADITSGAIWVMTSTSSGGGGAGIGYYSRIRYTDV